MPKKPLAAFEGLDDVIETVKAYMTALEPKEIEKVLVVGARIIRDEAKRRVRVKSGNLKKAIRAKKGKRRGKTYASAFAAVNRKKAPHAHLIEHGTVNAPAYPFLGPAGEAKEAEVAKTVRKGLAEGLEAVAKKRKRRARRTVAK